MGDYGEVLIYQSADGMINIEVQIKDETVWLTQQQMADLFQTSRTNIVEHIKHIYVEIETIFHSFILCLLLNHGHFRKLKR